MRGRCGIDLRICDGKGDTNDADKDPNWEAESAERIPKVKKGTVNALARVAHRRGSVFLPFFISIRTEINGKKTRGNRKTKQENENKDLKHTLAILSMARGVCFLFSLSSLVLFLPFFSLPFPPSVFLLMVSIQFTVEKADGKGGKRLKEGKRRPQDSCRLQST